MKKHIYKNVKGKKVKKSDKVRVYCIPFVECILPYFVISNTFPIVV